MKTVRILIVLTFCILTFIDIHCQQKSAKSKAQDNNFTIPEKWKDKSIVILSQEFTYSYLRDNNSLVRREIVTKKILLNDKNALSEFSTIYYRSSDNIEIQIIKPNKEIVKVNCDNAIKVEETVPVFFKTLYRDLSVIYYKLAIPGLQPGDIIIYNYTSHESTSDISNVHYFNPFKFTLSSKYPILYQKILFNIDRGFFIAFNSYNGAPRIKQEESGVDLNGRVRANIKTYSIEDNNRENYVDQSWTNENLYEPLVKFEVSYIPKNYFATARVFFDNEGNIKNKVDGNDVQELVDKIIKSESIDRLLLKKVNYFIKENHLETKPVEVAIRELYYYVRFYYFDVLSEYYYSNSYGADNPARNVVFSMPDFDFIRIFSKLLDNLKIKYSVMAALPAFEGRLSDVLFGEELSAFIKVFDLNKTYYLFPFTTYSDFNVIPSQLENQKAYEFSLFKNKKVFDSKLSIIPENLIVPEKEIISHINIDQNLSQVEIIDTLYFKSNFKERYSVDYLYNYNVQKEERMLYKDFLIESTFVTNVDKEKQLANEQKKVQIDKIKDYINSSYTIDKIDTFEVISSGINNYSGDLSCRQIYRASGIINKAGPNYIFNIGSLIGGQIKLEETDKIRKNDAFIDSRKIYRDIMTINYPEKYKLEGVEKLNVTIDNEVGHFQVRVVDEKQGLLKLEVIKHYKTLCIPLDNWNDMMVFLEKAFDFSQTKVLLKK